MQHTFIQKREVFSRNRTVTNKSISGMQPQFACFLLTLLSLGHCGNAARHHYEIPRTVLGQGPVLPTIVVHGGAGSIDPETEILKNNGTKAAVRVGYRVLSEGGTPMEAVLAAIRVLEDDPAFNAGRGSALTAPGHVENDASLMDGATMAAGTVASIHGIRHPIEAARAVMERTPHVQLAGDRATEWAQGQGLETADEV